MASLGPNELKTMKKGVAACTSMLKWVFMLINHHIKIGEAYRISELICHDNNDKIFFIFPQVTN